MICLVVGFILGPAAFNVLELLRCATHTAQIITEIGLLIAVRVGIKMRVPIGVALERADAAGHHLDGGDHRGHRCCGQSF
jgi:hypothetical protein